MGSKILNKILILLAPVLFLAAIMVLYHELKVYHLKDILQNLKEISSYQIWMAITLTIASYFIMTLYDALALRYVKHPLPYTKIGFASFIGYAFSNNLGLAMVSGGSVRYRLYSLWGLSMLDITKIIAFCTVTLWLGFFTLAGIVFLLEPLTLPAQIHLPFNSVQLLGILFLSTVMAFVFSALTIKKPFTIKEWEFSMPSFRTIVIQIVTSSLDWAFAGCIIYILLPAIPGFTFFRFLSVFLIAQVAGLASQIPGGLGIFETVVILFVPPEVPRHQLLGSLLVFRGIYYILPLLTATVLLGIQELLQRWDAVRKFHQAFSAWITAVIPIAFSLTTFLSGVLLLFSGVLPAANWRVTWLKDFLPLPVMEVSHFLGSIMGIILLLLARGISRRIDSAYVLTSILLAAGILFSLLKGLDYEEAIILSVMLVAFLPCHRYFRRKGSFISGRFSPGWITAILLVLLCSIWLGMFSFKHVDYSHDLWWSFTIHGDAPRFMRAMVGVLCTVFITIVWRLLSPAYPDQMKKDTPDMAMILPVVRASGSTHASLALLGDKSFLFSQKENAFIMYGISGRSWIAMGDPIGSKDEWSELIWRFREICDAYNGWPVFYEVRAENLYLYLDIGLSAVKIGEEGRVYLKDFSLEGGTSKNLRYTARKIEKDGYTFRIISREDVLPLLHEFKSISDSWLNNKATREKGFSLGFFDNEYLKNFPAGIIEKDGRIVAFTNILTGAGKKELSVDLMRYIPGVHNSLMEYMFIRLMLWGREQGYEWFSLGMAPFSGFESRELASLWHRTGALIFRYGEHFYNLQGLRQYKEKFSPVWAPKYLASPGGLFLPRILANISSLISGNLRGLVAK
ncbi:MAG: bifunctional lysylphosphatidylglycerol flippase/synthetase MprF [bacterium]